jgi:hypothetical protein
MDWWKDKHWWADKDLHTDIWTVHLSDSPKDRPKNGHDAKQTHKWKDILTERRTDWLPESQIWTNWWIDKTHWEVMRRLDGWQTKGVGSDGLTNCIFTGWRFRRVNLLLELQVFLHRVDVVKEVQDAAGVRRYTVVRPSLHKFKRQILKFQFCPIRVTKLTDFESIITEITSPSFKKCNILIKSCFLPMQKD